MTIGKINFPHMAAGPAKIRYDVGDAVARRNGMPMVPTACGDQIVSTLTTNRADKVVCGICNSALDRLLVKETIKVLLRWAYDTEQPASLVEQHHGVGRRVGEYRYRIIPGADHCVIVMIDDVNFNPLIQDDVDQLSAMITELGQSPIDTWNGAGSDTVSIKIEGGAHPTLLAGIDRYLQGCPIHRSVFCDDIHGCTWYRDGNVGLVHPVWPMRESLVVAGA